MKQESISKPGKLSKLNRFARSLLVVLFSGSSIFAVAQKKDTTSSRFTARDIKYFTAECLFEYNTVDTSIDRFHVYNPVFKDEPASIHLGNLGTAYKPLTIGIDGSLDYDIGMHQFDAYLFDPQKMKYYHTPAPFTELNYLMGAQNEQIFRVTHTQNIKRNFNFGLDFQKIRSDGFYQRQRTDYTDIAFYSWYRSGSGRYSLLGSAVLNIASVAENGGVQDGSFFETDSMGKRDIINVRLDSAENKWRDYSINLIQAWDMGFVREKQIDDTTTVKKFHATYRLSHSFIFQDRHYTFRDAIPMLGFYNDIYLDSLNTSDSLQYYKFENEISFKSLALKGFKDNTFIDKKHYFKLGANHILYQLAYLSPYITYVQKNIQSLTGKLTWGRRETDSTQFIYGLSTGYGFLDYNKGAYYLNTHIGYLFLMQQISLDLAHKYTGPTWIDKYNFSNHFRWDNNFVNITTSVLKLNYAILKWKLSLSVSASLMDDYIYYDTLSIPQQYAGQIPLGMVVLKKNFTLGKWHLDNHLVYQKIFEDDVIRIPEFWSMHSLYFESKIFKKVLWTQIGLDMRYHTPYYADAYMPATGKFYLQDTKLISPYPVVDFFINFKVKRARIFLKVVNVNQGLIDNGYFSVYRYPMPDRSFKGGISWRFYD